MPILPEGDGTKTDCSGLQDEQGPLFPPNGSTFEFVNPISSTSSVNQNPTEPNLTAIAPDRDLADVLS